MKKADLAEFRRLLLELQSRVRGDVKQLTDEALSGADGGELRNPTHMAELGTDAYEQDFSLRFVENDQEVLAEIESALKRIAEGTYGTCEMCIEDGKPVSRAVIAKTRLRAIPYARNCIECERKREQLTL